MKCSLPEELVIVLFFMDKGVIAEQGSPEQLFEHPQQERTQQFFISLSKPLSGFFFFL